MFALNDRETIFSCVMPFSFERATLKGNIKKKHLLINSESNNVV
jgi:hypothetical protein